MKRIGILFVIMLFSLNILAGAEAGKCSEDSCVLDVADNTNQPAGNRDYVILETRQLIADLKVSPSTQLVGEKVVIFLDSEDGTAIAESPLVITTPDGAEVSTSTDSNGIAVFVGEKKGKYSIKAVEVSAQERQFELYEQKTTALESSGQADQGLVGMFIASGAPIAIGIIALAIVLGVIFLGKKERI